jgi:hypothetical protein
MANPTLRKVLESIARTDKAGRTVLLPADVVKVARSPSHPLHGRFDWNDTKAAHKWRLHQARDLIASVQIDWESSPGRTIKVQAYHHLRSEGAGYFPTETIVRHETMRSAMVRELTEDARVMGRRLQTFRRDSTALRAVRGGVAVTLKALRRARNSA